MLVRMYEHKALMDAGRERTFSPGQSYEVSPVLGEQWVRAGVAVEDAAAPVAQATRTVRRKAPESEARG